MKQLLPIVCYAILICSCEKKNDLSESIYSTAVSVVLDPTDTKSLWPTPNPVLALYACEQHPDGECFLHIAAITDKKLNASFSSHLPDGMTTEEQNKDDDMQFRNKMIVAFYASVRKNFEDAYHKFDTSHAIAHSECWSTISTQLIALAKNKSKKKIMLVASDLLEKSDVLDAYHLPRHQGIQTIAEQLLAACPIPDHLEGITVFFVFEPRTRQEDKAFNTMLQAYKFILEKRGVIIHVQATNKTYEQ